MDCLLLPYTTLRTAEDHCSSPGSVRQQRESVCYHPPRAHSGSRHTLVSLDRRAAQTVPGKTHRGREKWSDVSGKQVEDRLACLGFHVRKASEDQPTSKGQGSYRLEA